MSQPDLIWIDDAARLVGRHRITIRRWIERGLLTAYKKELDRRVYVDRHQLLDLIENPPISER